MAFAQPSEGAPAAGKAPQMKEFKIYRWVSGSMGLMIGVLSADDMGSCLFVGCDCDNVFYPFGMRI